MLIPLALLAAGAVLSGWAGYEWFVGEGMAEFWRESIKILPDNN